MKIWFKHEKGLKGRIECNCNTFLDRLVEPIRERIPRFKLYSILNFPNKFVGQYLYKPSIYVHKSQCIRCGKCIRNCPRLCIDKSEEGVPIFKKNQCIHCYRCIHQCPQHALSLSKKNRPSKTLTQFKIQS